MSSNSSLLVYLNSALLLITLCFLVFIAHKIKRIHLKQYDAERIFGQRIDNLFSQLEALSAIHRDLGLSISLPATREWAASPDFLRHVARSASDVRPLTVVECSSGASTVVLAKVMQMNGAGHVFSLEHDPYYAIKTKLELERQGLEAYATVINAPLTKHQLSEGEWNWYETKGLPPSIDMLVVDGPPLSTQHLARYPAIPLLDSLLGVNGLIFVDDADRSDEREAVSRWGKEFGWMPVDSFRAEKGIAVLKRRKG